MTLTLEIQLPVLWIDLTPHIQIGLGVNVEGGDTFPRSIDQWIVSSNKGKTRTNLLGPFVQAWNDGHLPRDLGKTYQFQDQNTGSVELAATYKAGQHTWRSIQELKLTYTVTRRSWLGHFSPDECRGILNYVNGSFTVSHLPIGPIPKERDVSWKEVDDPEKLAVSIPGSVVTTEGWQIVPDSAHFEDAAFQFFR